MGTMATMGVSGDEKMTWDANNESQVIRARTKFQELLAKGYKAFTSKDIAGQRKGEEIKEFDKGAERLIMVPPLAGG